MGKWADAASKKDAAISIAGTMLTDEQAYMVPALFMPWDPKEPYKFGDRVRHEGTLYRCIAADGVQPNPTWTPDAAVSLWTRIDDPAIEWPEWVQPESTNPYPLSAKVSYNGKHWVSLHAANVWAPGTSGVWEEQV
jgi:hypothetical protein